PGRERSQPEVPNADDGASEGGADQDRAFAGKPPQLLEDRLETVVPGREQRIRRSGRDRVEVEQSLSRLDEVIDVLVGRGRREPGPDEVVAGIALEQTFEAVA